MPEVLIAIQARSGSKRLPGKSLRIIDDQIMAGHVFNTAQLSASYVNRASGSTNITAKTCLVVPKDDPLKDHFDERDVIEGPEDNVLERYRIAYEKYSPDYIVRLTGDCPLIIPTIITKHITASIGINLDYCSNAYEDMRTFVDGYDVEIISARAFEWLVDNATSSFDQEHVTTLLRREKPRWARFGVVLAHIDLADIKLSVDTLEDFETVTRKKTSLDNKYKLAKERGYAVFRF
jgi:spore coat polysaccharide biosynthesis protein SpsF (cytidylyltransferase family)